MTTAATDPQDEAAAAGPGEPDPTKASPDASTTATRVRDEHGAEAAEDTSEGGLRNGAAADARAERLDARDSVIGMAQAEAMELRDGLVGVAGAETMEIDQSLVFVAGSGKMAVRDSTIVLAGGPVEGENVKLLLTPQLAALAGAAFGLVFALLGWLLGGKKS